MIDHLRRSGDNFFACGPSDRMARWRTRPGWLSDAVRDPGALFVPVWRERSLIWPGDSAGACLLTRDQLPAAVEPARDAVLLGNLSGRPCFAVEVRLDPEDLDAGFPAGTRFSDLRNMGGTLAADEGSLLAYARAMLFWHRRHRFCGECGAPTRSEEAGHLRVCSDDACAAKHFPRTDPAIIVLATDANGERALLGRSASWPPRLYSCLAGFVEPGETLEHAVVREVREESGVGIARVEYRSSQPWPFPSSLMLGFRAVADSVAIQCEDEELEDVRWLSRRDIASGVRDGELAVPRRISIAYRLLEEWYDEGGELLARLVGD